MAKYYHDGSWWCVDIYANDFSDAEAICKKLNLQLDGEHIMTIPACPGSGMFVNAICAIRNFFWRASSVILALALCSCAQVKYSAFNAKTGATETFTLNMLGGSEAMESAGGTRWTGNRNKSFGQGAQAVTAIAGGISASGIRKSDNALTATQSGLATKQAINANDNATKVILGGQKPIITEAPQKVTFPPTQ